MVAGLLHARIDQAGNGADLAQDAEGEGLGGVALVPVTCTSSGAGAPKFRIWLVMSGGGKEKVTPGNSRGSLSRRVRT